MPALVLAALYALAAVRQSRRLRGAGLSLGSLYVLGGVLISLVQAL